MHKIFHILLFCFLCNPVLSQITELPNGFVYVDEVIPDVVLEMRYAGDHNFIGTPIRGYHAPRAILTTPAAEALFKVQQKLKEEGYCLKIFDAYRPQAAVNHFVEWARVEKDTIMKSVFYPEVNKRDLFTLGYISSKSGHSRGSTVDLTLIDAHTGEEIDMGGTYDFFGKVSHHDTNLITRGQKEKREFLKQIMNTFGFRPYPQEWWHYTLRLEPHFDTYFNFPVE